MPFNLPTVFGVLCQLRCYKSVARDNLEIIFNLHQAVVETEALLSSVEDPALSLSDKINRDERSFTWHCLHFKGIQYLKSRIFA